MAVPLAHFSERPGFTHLGERPDHTGPIAVRVDGSRQSFDALRAAADHSMSRSRSLVVIDATNSPDVIPEFPEMGDRELAAARGIFGNDHVEVTQEQTPGIGGLLTQASDLNASLLVLSVPETAEVAASEELLAHILEAPYNVLLMSPQTIYAGGSAEGDSHAGS